MNLWVTMAHGDDHGALSKVLGEGGTSSHFAQVSDSLSGLASAGGHVGNFDSSVEVISIDQLKADRPMQHPEQFACAQLPC